MNDVAEIIWQALHVGAVLTLGARRAHSPVLGRAVHLDPRLISG